MSGLSIEKYINNERVPKLFKYLYLYYLTL